MSHTCFLTQSNQYFRLCPPPTLTPLVTVQWVNALFLACSCRLLFPINRQVLQNITITCGFALAALQILSFGD
ncbi:uncharacterized protein BJ212DRAFT_1324847 [Suillus subaureus]|uniref:Uncharacterized protein n=1 Tax=Suillus subaureus TaxID=48587 RepID=A0A9P7EKC5_9AGAM|nr:uncharacterized protein BJ212DRAFT_1324847 [Suillus subaureus]KAG1823522.1 hypothetical protein BJ212DRAFT_1324847 [Suillus subaureus]